MHLLSASCFNHLFLSIACLMWFLCLIFLWNIFNVVVVNVLNWSTKIINIIKIMHKIIHFQILHTLIIQESMHECSYKHMILLFKSPQNISCLHSWEICCFHHVLFWSVIRSIIKQVSKNSCPFLICFSKAFTCSVSTVHFCAQNDYKQHAEKHTPVETLLVDRDCLNV